MIAGMDPISLEDLALLEVLRKIDQHVELHSADTEIRQRLIDSGLLEADDDGARLTTAGIELCKSLQHRVAADAEAEKIRQQREAEATGAPATAG